MGVDGSIWWRSEFMGKVADEAITGRRRRRTEDLAEVAATHAAAGNPAMLAERRRRVAVAEVRRALRTQRLAREAIVSADERAAVFVRVLANQGLAQSRIAAICGVPLWTVRRLLTQPRPTDGAAAPGDELG
jgi:DNA-directed RNA polymerase specialized sigma24 family protein